MRKYNDRLGQGNALLRMASKEMCDSCLRADQEISAISWCSDCEEKLCENCDKAHRVGKLTLSHSLNDLKEMALVPKSILLETENCENHQKRLDFYCTFHDALCCQVCIIESHRKCEKIESIEDVCQDIKTSAFFENMSENVSDLLQTTHLIVANRYQNIAAIQEQENNLRTRITSLKTEINILVEALEETLLSHIKMKHDQTASALVEETKVMEMTSRRLTEIKQELDFMSRYGSNRRIFLFVQKLRQKLTTEDANVVDILSNMTNVNLKLTEEYVLSTVISNLAEVKVDTSTVDIKHTPLVQKCVQSVPALVSFVPAKPIDLSTQGPLSISAIEILDSGNLLLCDCNEKHVLLYKEDGTFLQKNQLDGRPCQISVFKNTNQAAVTIFLEKRIIIIDISTLQIVQQVKTDRYYYGLLTMSDSSCMICGGKQELNIVSPNGEVNRTIKTSNFDFVRFIKKRKDGTFLFTDSSHVFCIDLMYEQHVFTYNGTTEARGIAQDKNGYIYVADKKQQNIHRLTPAGTFVDIVLDAINGIKSPLAISFNRDGSRLYVGSTESKIYVYNCK